MLNDKLPRIFLLVGLVLALSGGQVLAHKVNIFAYVEGDSVYTESYFGDGGKCRGSAIAVYDSSGRKVLEGITDDEGLLAFPIPQRTDLKLVLTASMGHRNEYLLSREEFSGGEDVAPAAASCSLKVAEEGEATRPVSGDLVRAVDQALARRISPLAASIRRLEKKQEQASFRDILGGIGYIVGLAGLYSYFRRRSG